MKSLIQALSVLWLPHRIGVVLSSRLFMMLGWFLFGGLSASAAAAPFPGIQGSKTLVAWVIPTNLEQRGGSILTLDDQQGHFDGIVFGEIAPSRWMAGSDFYHRSLKKLESVPKESSTGSDLVQVAIVYQGDQITLYRNGLLYSQYSAGGPWQFGKDSAVVFGLRHLDAQDGVCFAGSIEDARIYASALTAVQISRLVPNQVSAPAPMAWWNFESGKPEDVMGAFPEGKLVGKARIESGRLVLDGNGSFMATPASAAAKVSGGAGPDVSPEWVLNYHLMHPGAASLPGDPNPAFYLDGVYHLHYILGHRWRGRGSFSFVHVTSPDLLHWTWQSTQLQPSFTGHGMFSGTGFETLDGRPAAIYHGEGSGKNQIAIAKDRKFSAWEKPYAVDVRNADGSPAKLELHSHF